MKDIDGTERVSSVLQPGNVRQFSSARQLLTGIDHNNRIFSYPLHHEFHPVLRNGNTAGGKGFFRAEAVKENGGSKTRDTFLVITDIQAILILAGAVDQVLHLRVLQIESGKVPAADEPVIVITFT